MCIHAEKTITRQLNIFWNSLKFRTSYYMLYCITEFQRFVNCLINLLLCNKYKFLFQVLIAIENLISSFRFCIKETDFNGLESTARLEYELSKTAFSTIVQTVCAILCFERIAKKIRWSYPNSIFLIPPNVGNALLPLYV